MREGWVYKKLGEVATVAAGQGAPQGDSNYCENGTPFVKAGNLEGLINGLQESEIQKVSEEVAQIHRLKKYRAGSVLFAKSGMSCMKGFVYTLRNDCYVVSHLAIITPNIINSSFLNYFFQINKPNKLVKDSAYPSISLKDIENMPVIVPPLSEQQRIVSELDLLSSIIEKKKAQLKEYDQLAQSIFYDMFGDPVTNEKGWEVKKLGEVYKLKSGDGLSAKQFVNGQYPVYGGNGVSGYHNAYNMDGEYIIIGRVGAYCGNVRNVLGKFWLTDNAFQLIYDVELQHPIFVKYVLTYLDLHQYANHAAQPVISNITLKGINVPFPPLSLQQSFASKIEAIERQKSLIQQSITEAETLFNSRMDYWFS